MQRARVQGLEIAYERAGEGAPLVLVHGAGDDSRIWQPQVSALADELTVVAWDEPGAGQSSDVPLGFGLADYAECLAGLITTLDLGPVHLVGLSWGGVVALQTYADHPQLVGTLILADTYAGWAGSLDPAEVQARVTGVQAALAAPAGVGLFAPGMFAGPPPPAYAPLLEELSRQVRRESLAAQLAVIAAADLRHVLPRIAVPTLLVWGEQDVRSPLSIAREFERAIPAATLALLPRCGHLSNLEQPETFNDAVRNHCRAHPIRIPGDGPTTR